MTLTSRISEKISVLGGGISLPSQFLEISKLRQPHWFMGRTTVGSEFQSATQPQDTKTKKILARSIRVQQWAVCNPRIRVAQCYIRRQLHTHADNTIIRSHHRQVSIWKDSYVGGRSSVTIFAISGRRNGQGIRKCEQKRNRKGKPLRLRTIWKIQLWFLRKGEKRWYLVR